MEQLYKKMKMIYQEYGEFINSKEFHLFYEKLVEKFEKEIIIID